MLKLLLKKIEKDTSKILDEKFTCYYKIYILLSNIFIEILIYVRVNLRLPINFRVKFTKKINKF